MALNIDIINCGDIAVDTSFLAKFRTPGTQVSSCANVFLIKGLSTGPVLIDTGFRAPEVLAAVGMTAVIPPEGGLEQQLQSKGVRLNDVAAIIHTHLHIDHGGKDYLFPDTTRIIVARRELEIGCGGLGGGGYPSADMKPLLERVWKRDAIELLDIGENEEIELFPGVAVELAGGHTEGSLNVLVETSDGLARICGDVFYDIENQLKTPYAETSFREPHISGNTAMSERQERLAMKRAIRGCTWLLPAHDAPARLDNGRVVSRVTGRTVPEALH